MILKFNNGIMIQGFRITEISKSENNWSVVPFPEPFINTNIFLANSSYFYKERPDVDIGVGDKSAITIWHNKNIELIKDFPYGMYFIAIGFWK